MRLRILTRASDLARLQGHLVARALQHAWPDAVVALETRTSAGDRDGQTPLWQLDDKGAFTSDLSDALPRGDADIVVHSWKDLPIEPRPDTRVVATLPREDPHDVLLVRGAAARAQPPRLRVLTSSPRRALMLGASLPDLLPWRPEAIACLPVRGNVPTRIRRLLDGEGEALVVAKAALDRLLDPASPFAEAATAIRHALQHCAWMVLPLREHPAAAAQGALALEIDAGNTHLAHALEEVSDRPTWNAVVKERDILASYGGGCHQAIGVTVLPHPCGEITSVRGRTDDGERLEVWRLASAAPAQPRADARRIWPRPDESGRVVRRMLDVPDPGGARGLYVARAEALPASWRITAGRPVWAAGASTWRALAARGVWVHGSSEGLGAFCPHAVDRLAGRPMQWHRLTHTGADTPDALPTYEAHSALPDDLGDRTHFFWRSGSEFRAALARWPGIRNGWHASGPGRTFDAVTALTGAGRVRPCLGYQEWLEDIHA